MTTFRIQLLFAACVVLPMIAAIGCRRNTAGQRVDPKLVSHLRSLSVVGPNHVALVVEQPGETGSNRSWPHSEIRITADNGNKWSIVPAEVIGDTLACATMTASGRGWAINRQGQVFVTSSAGATWTKAADPKLSSKPEETLATADRIEFLNDTDGWAQAGLSVWRTMDGGLTWQETLSTLTPGVHGQPTGMFLIDVNTVLISGSNGQVYLTRDRGNTWRIQSPLSGNFDFRDVWFVNQKHGWLTGWKSLRPLLLETLDGGESWTEIPIEADILPTSVCFVGDEGWLAGDRRIDDGQSAKLVGTLLHTDDGGKHWNEIQFGQDEPFFTQVRFTDKGHGWLVGRDSLYRSEDGGKTWKVVLSLPPVKTAS